MPWTPTFVTSWRATSWKSRWNSSRRWVTTWPNFTVLAGPQAGLGKYFLERFTLKHNWASQVGLVVKNLTANAGDMRLGFNPWVGKVPWRRAWQPTPVFLPGQFHGQRSLAGYSLCGCKESDTTERLTHTHTHKYLIITVSLLTNVH